VTGHGTIDGRLVFVIQRNFTASVARVAMAYAE